MSGRATVEALIATLNAGDVDGMDDVFHEDAVMDWPQSGERIVGRQACLTVYHNYPGGPPRYELRRVTGGPDIFTVEAVGDYSGQKVYMTSIVEFRNGKIAKQTDYFADAFEAPAWRSQWVEHA